MTEIGKGHMGDLERSRTTPEVEGRLPNDFVTLERSRTLEEINDEHMMCYAQVLHNAYPKEGLSGPSSRSTEHWMLSDMNKKNLHPSKGEKGVSNIRPSTYGLYQYQ